MKLGSLLSPVTFLVSDQVDEVLLGIDWMRAQRCLLSFDDLTLTLHGQCFPLLKRMAGNRCHRLILQEEVRLPGNCEIITKGKIVYANLRQSNPETWLTETGECVPGVRTARGLVEKKDGRDLPVRILNTNREEIVLREGTNLCKLQEVMAISEEKMKSGVDKERKKPNTVEEHIDNIMAEVHPSVDVEQRDRLRSLLIQYGDILSIDEMDMGLTDMIQHEIDTGDERPVRQQLRRTPLAHQQIVEEHVQAMLKQGIIEPRRGDWASNIVLVQKKDGAFWFCVDFRAVNLKCKKEVYSIPRIDTSLDALAGSSWFSTLDLRSGYFQVPLDPKDSHKSSFITRSGCWKFKVLPMGMCNSSATFQRLMNLVLAGLTYSSCLVYLDDIVIMSSTIDEHYQRLGQVFERIRAAKLELRPDKCRILQREIVFLGHVVSGEGIRMDPRKIEVVRDWPRPKNLREVRSFLGLCAYYRKFVQAFSAIANPLHALTRRYARFDWSDTCQKAFETLKEKMLTAPVMSLPRDEGEYTLDTDASGWAIGAVLSQQQDGHERVIAYGSRLYSRAESRYNTTRQELLAVVYFVQYYKQYLLGRHFKIRTDHAALQWLLRTPESIGQQSRWVEQLSAYDFEIIHRAGGSHQNADAVSRWPYEPREQVQDQGDVR